MKIPHSEPLLATVSQELNLRRECSSVENVGGGLWVFSDRVRRCAGGRGTQRDPDLLEAFAKKIFSRDDEDAHESMPAWNRDGTRKLDVVDAVGGSSGQRVMNR